jgi:hypothetical protein
MNMQFIFGGVMPQLDILLSERLVPVRVVSEIIVHMQLVVPILLQNGLNVRDLMQ